MRVASILLIGYFVANQLSADLTVSKLAAMVDPFGGNAFGHLTQYWTPFQRNISSYLLPACCCGTACCGSGVGALILGLTYVRFSFSYAASEGASAKFSLSRRQKL